MSTAATTSDSSRGQRELLAIIGTANPYEIAQVADSWSKYGSTAAQAADHLDQRLNQLVADGAWTGKAAESYAARIRIDLIRPLRQFAENAKYISSELGSLVMDLGTAVKAALSNPVPWDEETQWRVEQEQVDRGLFSYGDSTPAANEAYEEAQSNAPYLIKTGGGAVRKRVAKPDWQVTVASVGYPRTPEVYGRTGVSVNGSVVRFDALMEFQSINSSQKSILQGGANTANRALAQTLPVGSDGRVGGTPEVSDGIIGTGAMGTVPAGAATGSGSGYGSSNPSSGSSGGYVPTSSIGSVPGGSGGFGSPTVATTMSPGAMVGTGSAGLGDLGGGRVGGMPGVGSVGSAGSGALTGGLGGGAGGFAGSHALGGSMGRMGTGAAGMGMMPPIMGGAGGGGGASAQSRKQGRTVATGSPGMSGGKSGPMTGFSAAGTNGLAATGKNASFGMGMQGRGTISPGNVGPVGNAQMGGAGAGGPMGAPMGRGGQRSNDEEEHFDPEQVYLDEDRSVWDTSVSAPPGHIR